jgi:single-strand DNA-binding protein
MPSFNQVNLIGNVTRDPQTKVLPSNTSLAEFGLAINRKYKTQGGEQREEVCFIDCAAFGKTADLIGEYVLKGKPLFVTGRLKYDSWEDKNGGGKRSKISLIVENFQLLGGRESAGDETDQRPAAPSRPYPRDRQSVRQPASPPELPDHDPDLEDVPF